MVKNKNKREGRGEDEDESNPPKLPQDNPQESLPEGACGDGDELGAAEQTKSSSSTTSVNTPASSDSSGTKPEVPSGSPAETSKDLKSLSPKIKRLTVQDEKRGACGPASPKKTIAGSLKGLLQTIAKSRNLESDPKDECMDTSNPQPICPEKEEAKLAAFEYEFAEQKQSVPGQGTEGDSKSTPTKRKPVSFPSILFSPKKTKSESSEISPNKNASSNSKCSCRNKATHKKGCPFRKETDAKKESLKDKPSNQSQTESEASSSSSSGVRTGWKDIGASSENSSSSSKSSSCSGAIPKVQQQDKSKKSQNRPKMDNDPPKGRLRIPGQDSGSDREASSPRLSPTVGRPRSTSPRLMDCNCSSRGGKGGGHEFACAHYNSVRRSRNIRKGNKSTSSEDDAKEKDKDKDKDKDKRKRK